MTPTAPMTPRGAAGLRLVRMGQIISLLPLPLPRMGLSFLQGGAAKQRAFCLSHLLSDQDNYKELLGAVDNAFLVAYAIGMFIR